MKGNLTQFESQVNNTIRTAYKTYKSDFKDAIGYLPYDKANSKKQARPHENDLIEDFEQDYK